MRLTDSSNLREQLYPTVVKLNDILGFEVEYLLGFGYDKMLNLKDFGRENRWVSIDDYLRIGSLKVVGLDEVYKLRLLNKKHTLIIEGSAMNLHLTFNPDKETYSIDLIVND